MHGNMMMPFGTVAGSTAPFQHTVNNYDIKITNYDKHPHNYIEIDNRNI
jgi:hypothetical protein